MFEFRGGNIWQLDGLIIGCKLLEVIQVGNPYVVMKQDFQIVQHTGQEGHFKTGSELSGSNPCKIDPIFISHRFHGFGKGNLPYYLNWNHTIIRGCCPGPGFNNDLSTLVQKRQEGINTEIPAKETDIGQGCSSSH